MNLPPFPLQRKPLGPYSGLTIVFSNPSRFDLRASKFLEGYAGVYFNDTCLSGLNINSCEIRLAELSSPLPFGTRVVLLLGQRALDEYCKLRQQLIEPDIKLDQQRGSPIVSKGGVIYIASYLPQDAMDMKSAFEKDNNEYLQASKEIEDDFEKEDANEAESKSTKGVTSRSSYRFLLKRDVQKTIQLLQGKLKIDKIDSESFQIYPPAEVVIHELTTHKGEDFFFDIETMDYEYNMSCFGFSFGMSGNIFVVPFYRYDYSVAYTELPQILWALYLAIKNNRCVGHNIAGFDLYVLAHHYNICCGRSNYDTMLAMHRLFPEIEYSLGHGISLYTTLPYHKNEGIFSPKNTSDEQQLWTYNGKDVAALKYLKAGITLEAAKKVAQASIDQVNESIRPYLTIMLTGIRYDKKRLEETIAENDKRLNALLKIITYLIGYPVLPSSPKQCIEYFHTALGMPIVGRSKTTDKPSLDEKNLLKLYIKMEHPCIPIFIYFRQTMKESGSLGFIPWKTEQIEQQPVINI